MNSHEIQRHIGMAIIPLLLTCTSLAQTQQEPESLQQKIQQMQQAAANTEKQLRDYQWIETTTVTIDGNPRPPKQSMCKYAADGTLQKTPLGQQEPPTGQRGAGMSLRGGLIRGMIAKEKKDKIKEEVAQIHSVVGLYQPFKRDKFKDAFSNGQVNLEANGEGEDTVTVSNYAKLGDQVKITLNQSTMRIERVSVRTYFDKPKDALTAEVQFSSLGDGTTYSSLTKMDAPTKKLSITTTKSDFVKQLP